MKILNLTQGSTEWLNFRLSHITATDSGTISGMNQYQTKHQLWEEKMGIRAPKIPNVFMTRGSILEPEARKVFENKYNCTACDVVVQSEDYEFAMASLDGFLEDGTILEIKSPGKKNYDKYKEMSKTGQVDLSHLFQMQHQMMCVGCKVTHYMVYSGRKSEYFVVDVLRDEDFIKNMVEKEKEFYDCMMNFEEPK